MKAETDLIVPPYRPLTEKEMDTLADAILRRFAKQVKS